MDDCTDEDTRRLILCPECGSRAESAEQPLFHKFDKGKIVGFSVGPITFTCERGHSWRDRE